VVAAGGHRRQHQAWKFRHPRRQVGLRSFEIGNKVTIAAQSGVMHDIPDGEKWFGYPAQPDRQTKRQILAIQQLPELIRRVAELEKKIGGRDEQRNSQEMTVDLHRLFASFTAPYIGLS